MRQHFLMKCYPTASLGQAIPMLAEAAKECSTTIGGGQLSTPDTVLVQMHSACRARILQCRPLKPESRARWGSDRGSHARLPPTETALVDEALHSVVATEPIPPPTSVVGYLRCWRWWVGSSGRRRQACKLTRTSAGTRPGRACPCWTTALW